MTVKLDDSPLFLFVFYTSTSFVQMTPQDAENTLVERCFHVVELEEYHWFFEKFQHSLVPKMQMTQSMTRKEICVGFSHDK